MRGARRFVSELRARCRRRPRTPRSPSLPRRRHSSSSSGRTRREPELPPIGRRALARAPHGVEALLLIREAAVVGDAVLAWRRSGDGKKGGAVDQPERRLPVKEKKRVWMAELWRMGRFRVAHLCKSLISLIRS